MSRKDKILALLSGRELSGAEIREQSKIWTGDLYPLLARLETAGAIESRWEPTTEPRPRRRLYKIAETRG